MKIPKEIKVLIPKQNFCPRKYTCNGKSGRCYLEDALDKRGYSKASVYGGGRTVIEGKEYLPVKPFNAKILEDSFNAGKGLWVTLKKN